MKDWAKVGLFVLGGAIVFGASVYFGVKLEKLESILGDSVRHIADSDTVKVEQKIIETAVEKSINSQVVSVISEARNSAMKSIRSKIETDVQSAVNVAYSGLKEVVSAKMTEQVARIDMNRLKKDVVDKATTEIVKKVANEIVDEIKENMSSAFRI